MSKPGDYPEMIEFIRRAMEVAQVSNDGALARKAGLLGARELNDIHKWRRGEHRPELRTALPLMKGLGLLTDEGVYVAEALLNHRSEKRPAA